MGKIDLASVLWPSSLMLRRLGATQGVGFSMGGARISAISSEAASGCAGRFRAQ
jgi:hypothetical protein